MPTIAKPATNADNRAGIDETEERIRDLIWQAFLIRQPDPRSLGCTAPQCRCVTPCDAAALPELAGRQLAELRSDAFAELKADPIYAFALESLGVK